MPKSKPPARKRSKAPAKRSAPAQSALESMRHPASKNLTRAVLLSDWNSAVALLARGALPDSVFPPHLDTPLWLACQNKDERMAKLLLGAGADPDRRSFQGEPPLALASRLGLLEIAVALCAAGATPLAGRQSDGLTALDLARELGNLPMFKLLIAALERQENRQGALGAPA